MINLNEIDQKKVDYCLKIKSLHPMFERCFHDDVFLARKMLDLTAEIMSYGYEAAKAEIREEAKLLASDREDGADIELGDYCQHKRSGFKGYCTTKITKMGELAQIALTPQELMVRGVMKGQPTHSMLFNREELEVIQPAVGF